MQCVFLVGIRKGIQPIKLRTRTPLFHRDNRLTQIYLGKCLLKKCVCLCVHAHVCVCVFLHCYAASYYKYICVFVTV